MFDTTAIGTWIATIARRLSADVLTLETLAQALVVAAAFGLALPLGPRLRRRLVAARKRFAARGPASRALGALAATAVPLVWVVPLWPAALAAAAAGWPYRLLDIAASLLSAWLAIRVAAALLAHPVAANVVAVVAWSVAALNITGLLAPTVTLLDGLGVQVGDSRVSLLAVINALLWLAALTWAALGAARLAERRLLASRGLTPSMQVLLGKLTRVALLATAVLLSLNTVGIDLTALTVFGGAIGLGLGFGLQKVVSNLVSGVILLLDKSVKPGDVVAISGTYGWINALGARYVSVITRDGIEHLIPNEELIANRVENWSYSSRLVRLHIPVRVAYGSDPHLALALCVEAAAATPRILPDPEPRCLLLAFGDNALELELRIWIDDPTKGVANVKSEVLLAIWDRFRENGLEVPLPQRVVHLRGREDGPPRRAGGGGEALGNGGEDGY